MEDCHFFLTAVCNKGDNCPFRHSEAAKNNPKNCRHWLAGHCSFPHCTFRHPTVPKYTANPHVAPGGDPSSTICYFVTQPSGCMKGDACPFLHPARRTPIAGAPFSGTFTVPQLVGAHSGQASLAHQLQLPQQFEQHPLRHLQPHQQQLQSRSAQPQEEAQRRSNSVETSPSITNRRGLRQLKVRKAGERQQPPNTTSPPRRSAQGLVHDARHPLQQAQRQLLRGRATSSSFSSSSSSSSSSTGSFSVADSSQQPQQTNHTTSRNTVLQKRKDSSRSDNGQSLTSAAAPEQKKAKSARSAEATRTQEARSQKPRITASELRSRPATTTPGGFVKPFRSSSAGASSAVASSSTLSASTSKSTSTHAKPSSTQQKKSAVALSSGSASSTQSASSSKARSTAASSLTDSQLLDQIDDLGDYDIEFDSDVDLEAAAELDEAELQEMLDL